MVHVAVGYFRAADLIDASGHFYPAHFPSSAMSIFLGLPVRVGPEYLGGLDLLPHDVMQGPGGIQPQLSGHVLLIGKIQIQSNQTTFFGLTDGNSFLIRRTGHPLAEPRFGVVSGLTKYFRRRPGSQGSKIPKFSDHECRF
jgi:hypothetical protein